MNPEEFVKGLKRDKARGNLAPHQIILLISFLNIYVKLESKYFDITELESEFQQVWEDYKSQFASTNNNIGLPLKAFINRDYIRLTLKSDISNFRNTKELKREISTIEIDTILIQLLQQNDIKSYLISKIAH